MTRARDVADTQDNVGGAVPRHIAGKNKIINGDFGIWQRGSSVTIPSGWGYGADRFRTFSYSTNTSTISRQAFTPGVAPVAGYEGQFFGRFNSTTNLNAFGTVIEDVRTFAGQTVTLSFWAKSASSQTLGAAYVAQIFGTGGSSAVFVNFTPPSVTTSWARYSFTIALPSVSGKTIGDSSLLAITLEGAINNAFDTWGWQLEAGSVATPFATATGSIQGELQACQRYYYRHTQSVSYERFAFGSAVNSNSVSALIPLKQTLRGTPTSIDFSGLTAYDQITQSSAATTVTLTIASPQQPEINISGVGAGLTQFRAYEIIAAGLSGSYIGISAEL